MTHDDRQIMSDCKYILRHLGITFYTQITKTSCRIKLEEGIWIYSTMWLGGGWTDFLGTLEIELSLL